MKYPVLLLLFCYAFISGCHPIKNLEETNNSHLQQVEGVVPPSSEYLQNKTIIQWNNLRDTIVYGIQGAKIRLFAGSFCYLNGDEIPAGITEIHLEEYYRLEDLLRKGFVTVSDGRLLETGGMIYISAFTEGKELRLKQNKKMIIGFPAVVGKSDMYYFHGEETPEGSMNWKTKHKPFEEGIGGLYVEESAEFPGGMQALIQYVRDNRVYPESAMQRGAEGMVYIQFIISVWGEISNVQVKRSLDPELDTIALNLVRNMPLWTPAQVGEKPRASFYNLPVKFLRDAVTSPEGSNKERIRMLKESADANQLRKTPDSTLYKVLNVNNLGWASCQHFLTFQSLIDLQVKLPNKHVLLKSALIFKNKRSVTTGKLFSDTLVFTGIPANEPVRILVITEFRGKKQVFLKDIQSNDTMVILRDEKTIVSEELLNNMEW